MESMIEFNNMKRPIELVNRFISIWPLEKDRYSSFELRIRPVHRIFMFTMVGILIVATTADVIHQWGNMDEVTECALIASAFYLSLARLVIYTIYEEDLKYVIRTIRADWLESCEEDVLVFKKKCSFAYLMAKHFIVTVVITLFAFMAMPFLQIFIFNTDKRLLPFRGYFFQNQTNSPFYELLYVLEVISGAFGGSTISGATTLNLMLVMHGAAKFSLVRIKLKSMKNNNINIKDCVAKCVRLHQEAILFANRTEHIINMIVLCQFVISTGLVCFAGFQISSMLQNTDRLIKYCAFINSAIFELFLFSYSGNELIIESESVGESIYESEWVGGKYMQDMHIIMMRSMIPNRITAGKFYEMSLKSFSSVLSTSFSYFTVLQAVNEE